ncbi:hypothetical protein [Sphingopyxis fribergensis]
MMHEHSKDHFSNCAIQDLSFDEIARVGGGLTIAEAAARQLYYTSRLMQIREWMTDYTAP